MTVLGIGGIIASAAAICTNVPAMVLARGGNGLETCLPRRELARGTFASRYAHAFAGCTPRNQAVRLPRHDLRAHAMECC
jgi:hypothetical protein